jgi:hypothetical protein
MSDKPILAGGRTSHDSSRISHDKFRRGCGLDRKEADQKIRLSSVPLLFPEQVRFCLHQEPADPYEARKLLLFSVLPWYLFVLFQ